MDKGGRGSEIERAGRGERVCSSEYVRGDTVSGIMFPSKKEAPSSEGEGRSLHTM